MQISKISNQTTFTGAKGEKHKRKKLLDRIPEFVKNTADMNDTVIVPRTIFKGYLSFMAGTSLLTIAGVLRKKSVKIPMTIAGTLINLFGTYAFVRPFIIKDKEEKSVEEVKDKQ